MKKTLICLLLVLLTLCLFVACSSSPKEEGKIIKLKIQYGQDPSKVETIDFNVGSATHFGEELVGKTIEYGGKTYIYLRITSTSFTDGVYSEFVFWDSGKCLIFVYQDEIGGTEPCCDNNTAIEEKTYNCTFIDFSKF